MMMKQFLAQTVNKNTQNITRVQVQDKTDIQYWCSHFDCSEIELFYCISKVGTSISSIESYMYMNRGTLKELVVKQLHIK